MKCLVYGINILEVVQSTLITELEFRKLATGFGDVQVFNRIETAWLIPTLTAIGELFRTEDERLRSNIPPRYILCPGILCASDQNVGAIEETCGSNYCCKFSKEVDTVKMLNSTQLSFIQLGGGVAVGVYTEQRKCYTLLGGAKLMVSEWSSIAVRTTTQVCSQLSNNITYRFGILGASFVISLLWCA